MIRFSLTFEFDANFFNKTKRIRNTAYLYR